jgi:hypothetical protein
MCIQSYWTISLFPLLVKAAPPRSCKTLLSLRGQGLEFLAGLRRPAPLQFPPIRRVEGCPSAVEVTAPPSAEALRPELPLQQHQAPYLGAVRANVRFDAGGQLADGGQVNVKHLRAPLQRRRDRPAHLRVVPGPHRSRLTEQAFEIQSGCSRRRWVLAI